MNPSGREHKIKVRLAVLQVTAAELAREAGIDQSQLHHWIRSDHRQVKERTMYRLGTLLGMSVEELMDTESWSGVFNDPIDVQKGTANLTKPRRRSKKESKP